MQRDILLVTEMIDAAEQALQLAARVTASQLETDRQRRDALSPMSRAVSLADPLAERIPDL
jgi:multidrug efflux pump subunit AcrA (membrane-fusion protein)